MTQRGPMPYTVIPSRCLKCGAKHELTVDPPTLLDPKTGGWRKPLGPAAVCPKCGLVEEFLTRDREEANQ